MTNAALPLTCRSYAKINFYLDVRPRRSDGYHDIETVFQTVSLYDALSLSPRPSGISLECNIPGLDAGPGNLVWRAAALLAERFAVSNGVHMVLEKHIPVAAGLAGGSGNAAAALAGLNRLWDLRLDSVTLAALALELGSDVPYCLVGGAMAATGRGEVLASLPVAPETWIVLVHPSLKVSTAAVYNSPLLEKNTEPLVEGRTQPFRRALEAFARGDWPQTVFNRMETAVFSLHPELAATKKRLLELGCLAAAMSGSGPTLFGVCPSREHAESVSHAGLEWPVSIVKTMSEGVAIARS